MFIMRNNKLFYMFVCVLSIGVALPTLAQEQKNDSIKEFLKESEFGLQRKQTSGSAIGKKGLMVEEEKKADVSDLVTVDLIDPFQNKTIKGTQTDLEPLDDGIDLDVNDEKFQEDLISFRESIEEYFATIENKQDINPIELLNNLKINRLVSSPLKYVEIQGKKYSEKDIIKVRVNTFAKQEEFEQMLENVKFETSTAEEAEILEDLKSESLVRFNTLTQNTETALNIIKVEVKEIIKSQVSFLIDDKTYKIIMKR